ncbi:YqaJ viral recombinase family protein [Undibacterium sp. MH2W]|uniref:YqaJ viral recombinase family protein n=1 Tax=Undibacterium sp. MH2W TaxID=3413044 RepID=UPI003BEF5E64
MQIHELIQGTQEWHEFRANHWGASEAAAMLGLSTKVKRNELLHMKATGTAKEFSEWVQENILDHGHEVEALARPIVEKIIGDDLYPVTCSEGSMSASCDGLTMSEAEAFEHKQWNRELAESVKNGILPEEYMPQCQQVLMVTRAKRLIFVVSDGTEENMVHMYIYPNVSWFERILNGWIQFEKDLIDFIPRDLPVKPQAEAIMALPALAVQIRGEVVLSNLPEFKNKAELFIASIKTDPTTDEDFANAEETIKFCEKAESSLELAKSAAIAQTSSIDELMRTVDNIKEQLRRKRLDLTAIVKNKKEQIKTEILMNGRERFHEHMTSLEQETAPIRLNLTQPDFAAAMKNKRTLASLHEAVDTTLANAKISADSIAADVRKKLAWFKLNTVDFDFLFNDLQQIIFKQEDDFKALIDLRITRYKEAEAQRLAAEKLSADQTGLEQAKQEAPALPVQPVKFAAAEVVNIAEAKNEVPTLTLGKIGARLGFALTADFLRGIGFEPAARERGATLYRESDWTNICSTLIAHIEGARNHQQAA